MNSLSLGTGVGVYVSFQAIKRICVIEMLVVKSETVTCCLCRPDLKPWDINDTLLQGQVGLNSNGFTNSV
jgi:hypothetical protein